MSIRDNIINAVDLPTEIIDVPEWDVKIECRGLTAGDGVRFLNRISRNGEVDRENFAAELLIVSCYDPDTGKRVFEDADRDMLKQKSATAVNRVSAVCSRLSGFGGGPPLDDGDGSSI